MTDEKHSVIAEFDGLPARLDGPESVGRVLDGIIARFGFLYYSVSILPAGRKRDFERDNYVNNLPEEILDYWISRDLANRNPFINDAGLVVLPVRIEVTERPLQYLEEDSVVPTEIYLKHGIHRLTMFPVQHRSGTRGWFTFAGNQPPLTEEPSTHLSVICLYIFNAIEDLAKQTGVDRPKITPRQIECLKLAAAGKTTSEIAAITELAEDTVNYHFVKAMKALDCVTRIQAVARAIELDLI